MSTNNIVHIPLEKLYHNPNNPRQEIGDVSEMADSIRGMGILQNLTVCPFDDQIHKGLTVDDPDDSYVVLIGNRRLEGGKEAGVATAPCMILDLDAAGQMEVMLVENLQRKDLTPVEEAFGFRQLSFELGKSIEEIAKKTGFSAATVRSRIKMAELDRDKMAEADKRGGTLSDYAALSKIKDLSLRNKVLESIGTNNFKYELKAAKDKEKNATAIAKRDAELKAFAKVITAQEDDMICVEQFFGCSPEKKVMVPADADSVNYFLVFGGSSNCYLYRRKTADEKTQESTAESLKQKCKENAAQLTAVHKRMKELRQDFISNVTPAQAKKCFAEIAVYASEMVMELAERYSYLAKTAFAAALNKYLGVKLDETGFYDEKELQQTIRNQPEYAMLVIAYLLGEHKASGTYFNETSWDGKIQAYAPYYKANDGLDMLYFFLAKLGYVMSDEENAIQNGTHECFYTDERAQEWLSGVAQTNTGSNADEGTEDPATEAEVCEVA